MTCCHQNAAALGSELSPTCGGHTKSTKGPGFYVCTYARMFQDSRGPSGQ